MLMIHFTRKVSRKGPPTSSSVPRLCSPGRWLWWGRSWWMQTLWGGAGRREHWGSTLHTFTLHHHFRGTFLCFCLLPIVTLGVWLTWTGSQRGEVTSPKSQNNRARTRNQICPGPGLPPSPTGRWRVCYLFRVRSFSFFFLPVFFPAFFWLGTSTWPLSSVPRLPRPGCLSLSQP